VRGSRELLPMTLLPAERGSGSPASQVGARFVVDTADADHLAIGLPVGQSAASDLPPDIASFTWRTETR
jgi:hypothetical protein